MARRVAASTVFIDWLPVLLVPGVLICDAALSSDGKPLGVVSVLSAFVGSLPLVLRRRVPYVVLAPLLVAGIVLVLWLLHPGNTVVLIPMVALYEMALSNDRRRNLMMALTVVPCVVVSILPFATGFTHVLSLVVRNLALVLLAIAAGDVVRSRRLGAQRAAEAVEQATLRRVGEERLQIAREIHDTVAHAMTAINVQAGVAAHLLERDPGQAHDALRHIKAVSGDALTDLRATLDVLRDPGRAAPLGPAVGLTDLAPLVAGLRSAGVAVDVHVDPVADVPAAVHGAGYRIVQEALTNVARHAHASRAQVAVRRVPGAVAIEVLDDGPGTVNGARPGNGTGAAVGNGAGAAGGNGAGDGNGMRGMRERAAALGGTLEAAPLPSGGWRVHALLPVTRGKASAAP